MINNIKNVKIEKMEALKNSVCGNPAWRVIFSVDGCTMIGRTATNSSCGYFLDYNSENKEYKITYHITKNGNIIINYAEAL